MAIWSNVLAQSQFGVHDDFFALGGHSLLAAQIVARARKLFDVKLPLVSVFEARSVAALAQRIEALRGHPVDAEPIGRLPPDAPLQPSFAQERLWFLHQLRPGDVTYNLAIGVRLKGPLRTDLWRLSLERVIARHDVLRTVFPYPCGEPRPALTAVDVALDHVELPRGLQDATEALLNTEVSAEVHRPFDLERGPLIRAKLFTIDPLTHVFIVTLHHIVGDGWSITLLLEELKVHYEELSCGGEPAQELTVGYADYAAWERRSLDVAAIREQLEYWRNQFRDVPSLRLPTDRPRPLGGERKGALCSRRLSRELREAVRRLGVQEGATLFMTILAAFKLVLGRHAGANDIAIGIPAANRDRAETERLIGPFLNTLVLRTSLDGNPTFAELLRRVRNTCLDAYAHQAIPFERVVEELSPTRDLSGTPLFQVMLNMLNLPPIPTTAGDVALEWLDVAPLAPKLDLTLYVDEVPEGIDFAAVYDANLFAAERVAEVLAQIEVVLQQAAAAPQLRASEISLCTATGAAVLPDVTDDHLVSRWAGSVVERLDKLARTVPERLAARDDREQVTYGELGALSDAVAAKLREDGVGRGDIVAIWARRCARLSAVLLGVWKAGSAFMILDPDYPPVVLAAHVQETSPRAFVEMELAPAVPRDVTIALDSAQTTTRFRFPIDVRVGPSRDTQFNDVVIRVDDLAYVSFTSGSGGRRRAVAGTHGPISHFLEWQKDTFGLTDVDRFSVLSGLSHDPLLRDLFAPIWAGGLACIPPSSAFTHAVVLADWFVQQRITVCHSTPAMVQVLLEGSLPASLGGLRLAFVGGDATTGALVQRLRRAAPWVRCINCYGTTETPQVMAWRDVTKPDDLGHEGALPVGRGIEGVELVLLNASRGVAGIGELAEIAIRTPYLTLGYVSNEDPDERFCCTPVGDRMFRTGDIGRYRLDGSVELVGRNDEQLNVNGYRTDPKEIENALLSLPDISQAAVVAHGSDVAGRRLVAYIVSPPHSHTSPQSIRDALRTLLPNPLIPAQYEKLSALPLTPNGKVDRSALPEPWLWETEPCVAPRTETEARLHRLWADVLDAGPIGVEHDFFDLGGHSLQALRLLAMIEQEFGIRLPLTVLFHAGTIGLMAEEIASRSA